MLEHSLEQHEIRPVGEEVLGGVRHLDREPALADASRPDEAHDAVLSAFEQLPHLCEIVLTTDRGRIGGGNPGDEGCRALAVGGIAGARLVEALGQQGGEIAGHPVLQIGCRLEREIRGGVVALDARDQLLQPLFAVSACLDVNELGHLTRREIVLVLEPGDLLAGRHPPVAFGIDADEHVALREIGAVQLARRVRPRAELEHHGREAHAFDGSAHGRPLVCEFAQGRTHENPDPLVGRADQGLSPPSHEHIMAGTDVLRTTYSDHYLLGALPTRMEQSACRRRERDRLRARTPSPRAPS